MFVKFKKIGFQIDIKKSEFLIMRIKVLDFIINIENILMNSKKMKTIYNWQFPIIVRKIHFFWGFCNFYRKFIRNYDMIIRFLTKLTVKMDWKWNNEEKEFFLFLKKIFVNTSIFCHFDL